MKKLFVLIAASVVATGAVAAPAVQSAAQPAQQQRNDLPNQGKVVSLIDTASYTYIEVTHEKSTRWLAAPRISLTKGAAIRYGNGAVMTNFHSKSLNRTFPTILFVSEVAPAK